MRSYARIAVDITARCVSGANERDARSSTVRLASEAIVHFSVTVPGEKREKGLPVDRLPLPSSK